MGVSPLRWQRAVAEDRALPAQAVLLSWVLQRAAHQRTDADGWFRVGVAAVAAEMHLSTRQTLRHLAALAAAGWLETRPEYHGGHRRENAYRLAQPASYVTPVSPLKQVSYVTPTSQHAVTSTSQREPLKGFSKGAPSAPWGRGRTPKRETQPPAQPPPAYTGALAHLVPPKIAAAGQHAALQWLAQHPPQEEGHA